MRAYLLSDYDAAAWYAAMRVDCLECWYCGRGAWDTPDGWYGPWLIERAHMVSNPRAEDRRAVIMLCSLCHRTQHGQTIALAEYEAVMPQLTLGQMLWIKWTLDRHWYDQDFLEAHHIGRLPARVQPSRVPARGR